MDPMGLTLIGLGNEDYFETFLRDFVWKLIICTQGSSSVQVGSSFLGISKQSGRIDLVICINGDSSVQLDSIFWGVFQSTVV
jgi:hypothetical protein